MFSFQNKVTDDCVVWCEAFCKGSITRWLTLFQTVLQREGASHFFSKHRQFLLNTKWLVRHCYLYFYTHWVQQCRSLNGFKFLFSLSISVDSGDRGRRALLFLPHTSSCRLPTRVPTSLPAPRPQRNCDVAQQHLEGTRVWTGMRQTSLSYLF